MSASPHLVRPAARSAAVRPHSASLPSPRPASAASRWRASLFFTPLAPARWRQSIWLASACWASGQGGVVTVTALVTVLGTPKPLQSLDIPEPLPRYRPPPAHVIRSRARACASPHLPLVTWEQRIITYAEQGLVAFPRPFPPLDALVTWEQAKRSSCLPDRLSARSNKVEAGNGDLQRAGGDARQKFRGANVDQARSIGRDLVEQQLAAAGAARIRQLPTRRGENGGFLPFVSAAAGRVGRLMLEGSAQAPEFAGDLGARLKLGRLSGRHLGAPGAGQLPELAQGAARTRFAARAPGAPNRARSSAGVPALHAGRIWIEHRAAAAVSGGHYSNRQLTCPKNAQTDDRRWGPGGAALYRSGKPAVGTHNREAGDRAGVNNLRLVARPHETGEFAKLRRDFAAVNGRAA